MFCLVDFDFVLLFTHNMTSKDDELKEGNNNNDSIFSEWKDMNKFAYLKSLWETDNNNIAYIKSINIDDQNETGLDRLKQVWNRFHFGERTIEGQIISNSFMFGGMIGFIMGGIIDSDQRLEGHIRKYNTNIYKGKLQANRQLSDRMYVDFMKYGAKLGLKYSLFSGLFTGSIILTSTYRNDIYFSDWALSGALSTALYKVQLGPRAMVVGGVLGSIFGLTFAGIIKLYMKIFDTNYREFRYYNKLDIDEIGKGRT